MNTTNLIILVAVICLPTTLLASTKTNTSPNQHNDANAPANAPRNQTPPLCNHHHQVDFVINDIFDLSAADTIFIHHWANFFHIKTKPITLENESAFFLKKCEIDDADLLELERHLRQRKYIREASVTQANDGRVTIETHDNWSLMPTVDFGRKGGINKYAIGIKDRNLLGLGVDAEVEYFSNNQRTGYKFDTQFPLFLNHNITGSTRITQNDDGSSVALSVDKPFVSFDTPYAFSVGMDNVNQVDTQFQNGIDVARYMTWSN